MTAYPLVEREENYLKKYSRGTPRLSGQNTLRGRPVRPCSTPLMEATTEYAEVPLHSEASFRDLKRSTRN